MDGLNFKIDNFADSIEFPSFSHDSAALLNLTGHALYAAEMARAMPGDTIGDGFRLIDLCCGIGGITVAAHLLGARTVAAADIKPAARKFFELNHSENNPGIFPENFYADITEIPLQALPDADVITAGFPCQSFSIMGKRKGMQDPRGTLIYYIAEIVAAKRPKLILLENVDNLESAPNEEDLEAIMKLFKGIGYKMSRKVLNATDFGLPASRSRLYFVGVDTKLNLADDFQLPQPIGRILTMDDIFEGDCERKIGYTLRGGGIHNAIDAQKNYDCYIVDGECRWLTTEHRRKMLGFPQDFQTPASEIAAADLFGNSVAVPVIYAILREAFLYLKNADNHSALITPVDSEPTKPKRAPRRKDAKATLVPDQSEELVKSEALSKAIYDINAFETQRTCTGIEIGQLLNNIRGTFVHKTWEPWLRANLGRTPAWARSMMGIARVFGNRIAEIQAAGINETSLIALLGASEKLREDLISRASDNGELFGVSAIKTLIKQEKTDQARLAGAEANGAVVTDLRKKLTSGISKSMTRDKIVADAKKVAELFELAAGKILATKVNKNPRTKCPADKFTNDVRDDIAGHINTALNKLTKMTDIRVIHTASVRSGDETIINDLDEGVQKIVKPFIKLWMQLTPCNLEICQIALRELGFRDPTAEPDPKPPAPPRTSRKRKPADDNVGIPAAGDHQSRTDSISAKELDMQTKFIGQPTHHFIPKECSDFYPEAIDCNGDEVPFDIDDYYYLESNAVTTPLVSLPDPVHPGAKWRMRGITYPNRSQPLRQQQDIRKVVPGEIARSIVCVGSPIRGATPG